MGEINLPQNTTDEDDVPAELVELVGTIRTFTDTTERIGVEEIGQAAVRLERVQLAYLLARLDDVLDSVGAILSHVQDVTARYGVDLGDAVDGVQGASSDLYDLVVSRLDPKSEHDALLWAMSTTARR